MATFKYTTFWQDSSNGLGWSENWYVSAADFDAAKVKVDAYSFTRLGLAMNYVHMLAQRLTNVDPPRDSLYFESVTSPTPAAGTFDPADTPAAGAFDVLLCRRDGPFNDIIGHLFLHAVPLGIFNGAKYPAAMPPGPWAVNFGNFVDLVTSGDFFLRRKSGTTYVYVVCTTFKGLRKSSHRVGRPFGGPVGRRAIA